MLEEEPQRQPCECWRKNFKDNHVNARGRTSKTTTQTLEEELQRQPHKHWRKNFKDNHTNTGGRTSKTATRALKEELQRQAHEEDTLHVGSLILSSELVMI